MLRHDKTNLIKIAIIEDHSLVRLVFKNYIDQQPRFKVVFEADDGGILLKELNSRFIEIDVLLLDLFSPHVDGRDTLKIISKLYPTIRTVILSACTDLKMISAIFDLGAYGFVSKTSEPEELCNAIISAANGKIYQNKFYVPRQNVAFTPTEIKVLELIWLEKTNEEISRILCLSTSAIEKIKHQLKEKTKSKNTIGIIKYALDRRIIASDNYELG